MKSALKVVGLGEVLWDVLPGGKQLGGAPANFAYMASLLGDQGIVASRVGQDDLGKEALGRMRGLGLNAAFVQTDTEHPTGTAHVSLDAHHQPTFTITEPVAWDFLEFTSAWEKLAHEADVVCFGTLAQRSQASRQAIQSFLGAARKATRVFDINLRQSYYSPEIVRSSLDHAQILKVNHEELPILTKIFRLNCGTEVVCAESLLRAFDLQLVCVTRGEQGSLLVNRTAVATHPGIRVEVADTVGAGDGFTACLVHHFMRGESMEKINEAANRFAAWVAGQSGGTPAMSADVRQQFL